MQVVSNIALISINETLLIQLASFLIFLFIIHRIMIRPLRDVIGERQHHLQGIENDIENANVEVDSLLKQLKARESYIRTEALEQKSLLEEAGNQSAKEILAEVQAEINELKNQTEQEVNAQLIEAKKHFGRESELLATQVMEKILDRRLN